jgi:hypothetical protein
VEFNFPVEVFRDMALNLRNEFRCHA